ncbi:SDR family NAD(P)-dependent oxidoreductase [Bacteroidota bacterium]
MKELNDLVEISRYYGSNKDYTLAGGGNTSYKNEEFIWVKASGAELATITEDGFAQLFRKKVQLVAEKLYSDDAQQREVEVKEDLIAANVNLKTGKRPSVETSFHEIIRYAFVVHMHPTMTNALMCAQDSEKETRRIFGDEVLYIRFAPGYELFMLVKEALAEYRRKFTHDPKIIFLENHGVFVCADNTLEIKELYSYITESIQKNIPSLKDFEVLEIPDDVSTFLPYMRMKLSQETPKAAFIRHTALHQHFYESRETFAGVSGPFTPDIIVYCKSAYLYIDESASPEAIIKAFDLALETFVATHEFIPKIVLVKGYGLIVFEDNARSAEIALEVYEDLMKVSYYSRVFGGPRFLAKERITFIDNWEVENFRRKMSMGKGAGSKIDQRVVIVTGAAQGFGEGIAEDLVLKGANVVVADLNEDKGKATATRLKALCAKNAVEFCAVDVSDPASLEKLVRNTVKRFGGLDILISNAGILHAGGIDEISPDVFRKMTEVNYNAWFYCVRAASEILKLQYKGNSQFSFDLIQINSKSGLQGSNRNFAYSGAKFGGIGLTQSFALELAPLGIKVNAVCPGNFFEGPLWSDPEKGLFVQYLKAGKVPGAKTIDDVKAFYEDKVPLKRGCRVSDVMKAIYYIIDQEYETGQAIPVTGGQVMLG